MDNDTSAPAWPGPDAAPATQCLPGGLIAPFHAKRDPPSLGVRQRNRARRRSPLCHDMLDLMLGTTPASSRENLRSDPARPPPPLGEKVKSRRMSPFALDCSRPCMCKVTLFLNTEKWPSDSGSGSDSESDASIAGTPDDGFDGQCDVPSLAAAGSTAVCSRAASLRSKCGSEASSSSSSSSSTQTKPPPPPPPTPPTPPTPPRWWQRRSLRRPRSRAPEKEAPGPPLAPVLEKLRRTLSLGKQRAAKPAPRPAEPRAAVPGLGPGAARSSSCGSCGGRRSEDSGVCDDDVFDVRWTMLMCKGAANLHVVSVPVGVSSLGHRDTFVLYPCLYHSPPPAAAAGPLLLPAASGELPPEPGHSGGGAEAHAEALLAHEYVRQRSARSLEPCAIYVWLGARASPIKRDAISRLAAEIRDTELLGRASVVTLDGSEPAAGDAHHRFFAQLHAAEHGGRMPLPREISATMRRTLPAASGMGSDMDFERALQRRKVLYGFWEAVPPASIVAADAYVNAAALAKVPAGGAVVLDAWSDVFVWWRDEPGNPAVRRCALNFANMLISDVCIPARPDPVPVWREVHGSEHVVFKTKFADWPFVFAPPAPAVRPARRAAARPAAPSVAAAPPPPPPVAAPPVVVA
ncbi:hypothetical protein H4R18_002588 [Coemansia javaensis]|uniref:Gelsolin-like domain-containing protein n=1 Tax=Coemansia javaensis TaxID=2761396 RepID=A0A9W8HHW6_9FUNG|nr:hypothetical protein H4R18_002588 [Coemansia javaensis]